MNLQPHIEDGYRSALAGRSLESSPWKPDTVGGQAWAFGWQLAQLPWWMRVIRGGLALGEHRAAIGAGGRIDGVAAGGLLAVELAHPMNLAPLTRRTRSNRPRRVDCLIRRA